MKLIGGRRTAHGQHQGPAVYARKLSTFSSTAAWDTLAEGIIRAAGLLTSTSSHCELASEVSRVRVRV